MTDHPPRFTSEEEEFLAIAHKLTEWGLDFFAFQQFAFLMPHSPVFSRSRSHYASLNENPVYLELRRMWLELGERQGILPRFRAGYDDVLASTIERHRSLTGHARPVTHLRLLS